MQEMETCIETVIRNLSRLHSDVRGIEVVRVETRENVLEIIVEVKTANMSLFYKCTVRRPDCRVIDRELIYAVPLL